MAGMPGFPMQAAPNMAMPVQAAPQMAMPMTQPQFAPPMAQAPLNQWQPMPAPARPQQTFPLAQLASGNVPPTAPPIKARGVAAEPAPVKFVLPSPEELGVGIKANPPAPQATQAPIDWNQIHARMDRLGVLRHERNHLPAGGVRIMLLLPTANPALGQPIEAIAETEAGAIALALDRAEAWRAKR